MRLAQWLQRQSEGAHTRHPTEWSSLSVVVYRDADVNAVARLSAAVARLAALVTAGRVPLLHVRLGEATRLAG